ncbi:MAG: lysoplasmalogenase family protein [Anaerolineae bacterium]|nr:lysoplasmalogenase family protein [Anaerolineae bacterium]
MLTLPYPAPLSLALWALLALDVLLLCGGLALGRPDAAKEGRLALPIRMSLSALLVVAALLQWRQASPGSPLATYAGRILLGMMLGFLGDLVMARLLRTPEPLISGMLCFGLGHLAYGLAFVGLALGLQGASPPVDLALGAGMAVLALFLWARFVRRPGGSRVMNVGALLYSLLLAVMNAAAIGLAIRQPRFVPLVLGTLLFLLSDLVLGNWRIRGHAWRGVNDVVWVTYNLGQALIVFSVATAAGVLGAAG